MNKILEKIKSKLIMAKIYIIRSAGYVGLANSLLLILVLLKVSENVELQKYMILIVIGWVTLLIFIGWLEINVAKVLQTESIKMFNLQPPMVEMKQDVVDIKSKVIDLEQTFVNLEQTILNLEQAIKTEDKNG